MLVNTISIFFVGCNGELCRNMLLCLDINNNQGDEFMKKCDRCNTKFKIKDGFKSFTNNEIKCEKCGAIHIKNEMTISRLMYQTLLIYFGVAIFLKTVSEITPAALIIYLIIITIPYSLYDRIPHKLHKYEIKGEKC